MRIWSIISILLAIALLLAIGPHPTATALSVTVPNLPVKKTVEKIPPVTVQVKSHLTITLPPVINTTPAREVISHLRVPQLPQAPEAVQATAQTIPAAASAEVTLSSSSTSTSAPSSSVSPVKKSTPKVNNVKAAQSKQSEEQVSGVVLAAVPFGGADFLNVAFAAALQNSADQMPRAKADDSLVIASAGAFLLSLTAVMSIIYIMLRKNIIPSGSGVLSQLVTYHSTRTQILVLIAVVLVAELIGIFLVLSLQAPSALWQDF